MSGPAVRVAPAPGLVIAGSHSGVGKTTVAVGLMGALARRGLVVQPFKVGPDFIDPLHHARVAGRPSRNLDGWMLEPEANRATYASAARTADIAIVEGVMGLFDGSDGASEQGSTAEMAKMLGLPVLLVIDAGAMARSAGALVHGFATFDPQLRLAGVILNNVGGEAHAEMIAAAMPDGVALLGALPHSDELHVHERHLGLHLPHETRREHTERLASAVAAHVDLDALVRLAREASGVAGGAPAPIQSPPAHAAACAGAGAGSGAPQRRRARIGLARDEAFCFYYEENLDLLRAAGAELVEFSPLRDPLPDGLDGLYVGGGYPELHAAALAANTRTREAIAALAASGAPVYGECGGLMYLAERLDLNDGAHAMCGALPLVTSFPGPLQIDYVEASTRGGPLGAGRRVRGHLFHSSRLAAEAEAGPVERLHELQGVTGGTSREGFAAGSVLAGYAHLHFASCPAAAAAFVGAASARPSPDG
jgi:cobyrinic acid a,c-diamide synthase